MGQNINILQYCDRVAMQTDPASLVAPLVIIGMAPVSLLGLDILGLPTLLPDEVGFDLRVDDITVFNFHVKQFKSMSNNLCGRPNTFLLVLTI